MKKNVINILREKIKKINLEKNEVFYKILKSINQNNNINNKIKIYSQFKINRYLGCFLSRQVKICLKTGNRTSILKGFNFSRYKVKQLILNNNLTNIKKNNW